MYSRKSAYKDEFSVFSVFLFFLSFHFFPDHPGRHCLCISWFYHHDHNLDHHYHDHQLTSFQSLSKSERNEVISYRVRNGVTAIFSTKLLNPAIYRQLQKVIIEQFVFGYERHRKCCSYPELKAVAKSIFNV